MEDLDYEKSSQKIVYVTNPEFQTEYHCAVCVFRSAIIDDFLNHKIVEGHSERGYTNNVGNILADFDENTEGEKSNKQYSCEPCGKTFPSIRAYKRHVINKHEEDNTKDLKCQTCNEKYASVKNLNKHWCRGKKVPCPICGKYYSRKKLKYTHMLVHSDKNIKCELCDYITSDRQRLASHKMVHSENKYICDICSRGFSHNTSLKTHMRTHEEKVPCPYCGKEYTPPHLTFHIKNKHNQDEKYVCSFCFFETSNIVQIEAHKKSEHSDQHTGNNKRKSKEKNYECKLCDLKFNHRHSRRLHMNAKHGDTFYSCAECSFKATQKGSLNRHTEKVHRGKKEKCPHCQAEVKFLDQHKRYKHPEHYKMYACNKCSYRSQHKSLLQKHLNSAEKNHD